MPVEDVQRLFEQVGPVGNGVLNRPVLRDRAMLELYLNGLRRIEVFRLTTDAVRYDPEEQTLVVRPVGKGEREGQIWLNANSASWLALYLLVTHAPQEYRDWIAELDQSVLLAVDRLLRRKLLDVSQPVFDLSLRQANTMFERYRDAAGLSKAYGPHSLRHTCATQLLENGVDIRVVQEILRHRSIKTTEIYTAVSKGLKGAAMQKLPTFAYAGAGV